MEHASTADWRSSSLWASDPDGARLAADVDRVADVVVVSDVEVAHGEHESRTGEADPNWPEWYAASMVAEQSGADRPA